MSRASGHDGSASPEEGSSIASGSWSRQRISAQTHSQVGHHGIEDEAQVSRGCDVDDRQAVFLLGRVSPQETEDVMSDVPPGGS